MLPEFYFTTYEIKGFDRQWKCLLIEMNGKKKKKKKKNSYS